MFKVNTPANFNNVRNHGKLSHNLDFNAISEANKQKSAGEVVLESDIMLYSILVYILHIHTQNTYICMCNCQKHSSKISEIDHKSLSCSLLWAFTDSKLVKFSNKIGEYNNKAH